MNVPSIKMEMNIPSERILSIMQDSYGLIVKEMEKTVKETMWKISTGEIKINIDGVVEETLKTSFESVIRDTVKKVFYEQTGNNSEIRKMLETLAQDTLKDSIKKCFSQLS